MTELIMAALGGLASEVFVISDSKEDYIYLRGLSPDAIAGISEGIFNEVFILFHPPHLSYRYDLNNPNYDPESDINNLVKEIKEYVTNDRTNNELSGERNFLK